MEEFKNGEISEEALDEIAGGLNIDTGTVKAVLLAAGVGILAASTGASAGVAAGYYYGEKHGHKQGVKQGKLQEKYKMKKKIIKSLSENALDEY